MANKSTKAKAKAARKAKTHFHGKTCVTDFKLKDKNPDNGRKSAWRGMKKGGGERD
jgi:hypothetical protein